MLSPILEMKGISKLFPGVVALDKVDLEIYPGEVVALIGENGAGKSTLMKVLGGVYQPDEGSIVINNQTVSIHSVSDAHDLGIAFIHQELNVLDNLDVASNIFLHCEPRWGGFLSLIDRTKMYAEAQTHLHRLGLDVSSRTPLSKLSMGHQQMVEIAKALSKEARILIMDEPTSSLTLSETDRLIEVVKDLSSHGVSIIYISHRLGEVQELADRVVALRDGRNAGGLEREAISHDQMVRMMVGRDLEDFYVHPEGVVREPCFEVRDLRTRRYPERAVSFKVNKGEIVGFAGLVGAGRSELAQAIFGVDPAVGGGILLEDKPVKVRAARDAIGKGIYLIPEDRRNAGLILEDPIRTNITLPSLLRYASAGLINFKSERKAASDIFKKLNVKAPSVEELVENLSGGNQQKVVLAKWLSLRPHVLIFDEPTRGIDVGAKAEIYELMRGLAESGVAIMMISSDMEEILGVSDRVAVMHEGRLTGVLERSGCNEEAIMRLAVGVGGSAEV